MEIYHHNGADQDDDQKLEIVDYNKLLQESVKEDDKVYGRKNKPRAQEPSMYDILTWKDNDEEIWNYTVKNKDLLESSALNKIKYKIKKASTDWVSENMDQFRKFAYSPDKKKPVFIDMSEPKLKSQRTERQRTPSPRDYEKAKKKHDIYVTDLDPKFTTATQENYAIKNLKTLDDVRKELGSRDMDRKGNMVKKSAKQLAEEEARRKMDDAVQNQENQEKLNEEEEERRLQEEEEERRRQEEESKILKTDYSHVGSKIMQKKIPKAKQLDPVYEKDRLTRRKERIKVLNETTRWLPNTAFYTYFGKPPFENYGRGNVNPSVGGTVYGDYMRSHNVNPHRGGSSPEYKQVYAHADMFATKFGPGQPEPPRKCKEEFRLSEKQVKELLRRNPLEGEKFNDKSKKIIKPDLLNSLRFASEENTPEPSEDGRKSKPVNLAESLKNLQKTAKTIRKATAQKKDEQDRTMSKSSINIRSQSQNPIAQPQKPAAQSPVLDKQATQKAGEKQKALEAAKNLPLPQQAQQEKDAKYIQNKMTMDQQYRSQGRNPDATNPPTSTNTNAGPSQMASPKEPAKSALKGARVQTESSVQTLPQDKKNTQFKTSEPIKETNNYVVKQDPRQFESPQKPQPQGQQTLQKAVSQQMPKASLDLRSGDLTSKQDQTWNKINDDMEGGLEVDPMNPPKNYLFSLSTKETNPKFYQNVPAVWLNRIPFAGNKNPKSEDIKNIFNYDN